MCWCTTEQAQVIDNKALSMLGNEISCLLLLLARPASLSFFFFFFCGSLKNPRERTGDKRRRNYRKITQPEQRQAGQTGGPAKTRGTRGEPERVIRREERPTGHTRLKQTAEKTRGIMGVSLPLPLSPLDRYQPSGCSVTPDPIFPKTVSLSTPRLCHSISVHLAVSLHPQAPNLHYSFTASRVRSTVTVAPWRGFWQSARFRPPATFRVVTCAPVHRRLLVAAARTGTHIRASRPSDVHRHTLNWQSASCRGQRADVAPVSHVSLARN